jgi:hypothetical protein
MRNLHPIAGAVAIVALTMSPANQSAAHPTRPNLLVNGHFAVSPPPNGCDSGTTRLPGWTVATGTIDILSQSPACGPITTPVSTNSVGAYFLNLNGGAGTGPGTISQSITTRVGTLYKLFFYFGGDPEWQTGCFGSGNTNDGSVKSMNVIIGGVAPVTINYSIDTSTLACDDAGWTLEGAFFTASTETTTISFQSLDETGVYGPLLAGVVVILVTNNAPP